MARFQVAGTATVIGTTARAIASVFSSANAGFYLLEAHIFNTTNTTAEYKLCRFTAATNVGAGLTEEGDDTDTTALSTGFAGHTGDGTVGGELRRVPLGASIGSGVILTFGGRGIRVPEGTANGIGWVLAAGTGQICDYCYVWEE